MPSARDWMCKLAEHTADELNTAFGIPVKKKKGNALR